MADEIGMRKPLLLAMLAVLAWPATPLMQSLAQGGPTKPAVVDVTSPLVVGFFPPFTEAEKEDDDGGIGEVLSHVGFALEDIANCYDNKAAEYRLEETRSITLRDKGRVRRIQLSRRWDRAVGILMVAPGRDPRIVFASAGPSSLQYLGPEAAFHYFGAKNCKSK